MSSSKSLKFSKSARSRSRSRSRRQSPSPSVFGSLRQKSPRGRKSQQKSQSQHKLKQHKLGLGGGMNHLQKLQQTRHYLSIAHTGVPLEPASVDFEPEAVSLASSFALGRVHSETQEQALLRIVGDRAATDADVAGRAHWLLTHTPELRDPAYAERLLVSAVMLSVPRAQTVRALLRWSPWPAPQLHAARLEALKRILALSAIRVDLKETARVLMQSQLEPTGLRGAPQSVVPSLFPTFLEFFMFACSASLSQMHSEFIASALVAGDAALAREFIVDGITGGTIRLMHNGIIIHWNLFRRCIQALMRALSNAECVSLLETVETLDAGGLKQILVDAVSDRIDAHATPQERGSLCAWLLNTWDVATTNLPVLNRHMLEGPVVFSNATQTLCNALLSRDSLHLLAHASRNVLILKIVAAALASPTCDVDAAVVCFINSDGATRDFKEWKARDIVNNYADVVELLTPRLGAAGRAALLLDVPSRKRVKRG